MAKKRNSLVENINRRKRKGTSRPKSKSTVSKQSYQRMEAGWPKRGKAKKKTNSKKTQSRSKSRGKTSRKTTKKKTSRKK